MCMRAVLPTAQQPAFGTVLDALAARIARNREIAGLHYPTKKRSLGAI